MAVLFTWWAWLAAALVFAILEVLAPVFIFLGFCVGAAAVGLLLALGVGFGGALAWILVLFALVSLASTVGLRLLLGARPQDTKTYTEDINKD